LRILQLSSAQAFGGGERHLASLANALAARGHDVHVALRPNSPLISELTSLPKQNLWTIPLRNALDAKSASRLSSIVGRQKIDVVHAHMARDYTLAAYAARRNSDARLIVTRHVLFPLNQLHRITLSKAARVIAVSEAVKRQLSKQGIVSPDKISVVHNGVVIVRFEGARRALKRERFCRGNQIPEGSLIIGSVGELTPLKGHENFLKSAAQLSALFPNAYFIVSGVDASSIQENRRKLESLIRKLNLTERVRLIGRVDDITFLYCALDVFVSASLTESFGLAIAEAMSSGVAVVATRTEGASEIVRDGKTGVLVPLNDVDALGESIRELLENGERRQQLGKLASEDVRERFNLDRMVDKTEKIYRESLSER
jgi:glycosyltransferase involved in cell wall biosynthesis